MRRSPDWIALAVVCDLIARVVRAAEFIEDGEVEEALTTLADLERELRTHLREEAA